MRKRFEDWGAELSDADFACALAAAGVLWGLKPPRGTVLTPELLASRIWLLRTPEGILPWRLTRLPPPLDARLLLESWRSFRRFAAEDSFRIEVQDSRVDLRWVLKRLSRPEVGAAGVESWEPPPTRGRSKPPAEGSYSVGEERGETHRSPGRTERPESRGIGEEGVPKGGTGDWSPPKPPRGKNPVPDKTAPEPSPRFLQAQLQRRPRGWYQVNVRIGLPDREWRAVETPFPVPPEPPELEGHRLTVIFWEPRVCPDARIEHLWLPPAGNSEPVSFSFERLAGVSEIAARITVLHNNRVLQTGLLRAPIGGPWTFTLDATPRTRLEGLSARSEFDVALVLNHDDEGTARATVAAGDKAVVIPISESSVTGLTRALSEQISKIATSPERYETLQSEGTEELLLTLAQKGGGLHRSLSKLFKLDKLIQPDAPGRPPRVHLTSALPDSFFPAELLYRFPVPEDTARLCGHALTGLAAGACPPECPSDKSGTVCLLGFWGLCSVIERHSYLGEHEKPAAGFHLRPEPVQSRNELDISGKVLLAASDAASKYETGAVQGLLQKLRGRGPAELVSSWKDWSARLADRPKLLVLLPHHKREGSFEILEIGASDPLKSEQIEDIKHVRISERDKPIVVLMGCDTNLARIAFDNFVTRFITEGAAIVVSTIATILGRHASPATARLIELMDEEAREGNSSFGEVMLRLRQSLVAEETPMALGLTAYGDADWILTRQD